MAEESFIDILKALMGIDIGIKYCDTVIFDLTTPFHPLYLLYTDETTLESCDIMHLNIKQIFDFIVTKTPIRVGQYTKYNVQISYRILQLMTIFLFAWLSSKIQLISYH